MEEFDDSELFSRPRCNCFETEADDIDLSFCYVETSKLEKSLADDNEELTNNVWFDSKPPKGLGKEPPPRITARQVQVARVKIEGRKEKEEEPQEQVKRVGSDANHVSVTKKKAAVEFLSVTSIEDEED